MSIKVINNQSDTTYIFFGGVAGGMGFPQFEFLNFSESLNGNKIFITDEKQSWYSMGVNSDTHSIKETASYIKLELQKLKSSKIICCGNSMGGYAALIIGLLINADRIIAFSPQTTVRMLWIILNGDYRWFLKMVKANVNTFFFPADVKDLYINGVDSKVEVFVGNADKYDVKHANRLKGINNVFIKYLPDSDHNLIKELRRSGDLLKIFNGEEFYEHYN